MPRDLFGDLPNVEGADRRLERAVGRGGVSIRHVGNIGSL
jgi:hypothetical protein